MPRKLLTYWNISLSGTFACGPPPQHQIQKLWEKQSDIWLGQTQARVVSPEVRQDAVLGSALIREMHGWPRVSHDSKLRRHFPQNGQTGEY